MKKINFANCSFFVDQTTELLLRGRSPLWISGCIAAGWGLLSASSVFALPQNPSVQSGSVTINQPQPGRLNIRQDSSKGLINWEQFSIGVNEQVHFQQPSVNAVTLNRVTGDLSSHIAGTLKANGTVLLLNPNGILFSPTAKVDVGGILATTLEIKDQDFLADKFFFQQSSQHPLKTVENQGSITVREGGFAALVAPGVENQGIIQAQLGQVILGSGTAFTLDFYQDGLLSFEVDPSMHGEIIGSDGTPIDARIDQNGTIRADGGAVYLTAQSGADVLSNIINLYGLTQARTVQHHQGKILLSASPKTSTQLSGVLDVSGNETTETGSSIEINSGDILLTGAALKADAVKDGGKIRLNATHENGQISIDANTSLTANSLTSDAGQIEVLSEGVTSVEGQLTANAQGTEGNGGFIETSGAQGLSITSSALVEASAKNGSVGQWVLDPDKLFITETGGGLPIGGGTEESVAASVIETALETSDLELKAKELIEVNHPIDTTRSVSGSFFFAPTTLSFNDENASPLTVNLNASITLAFNQELTGQATLVNVQKAEPGILQNAVDVSAPQAVVNINLDASEGTFYKGTTFGNSAIVQIDKDLTIIGQGINQTKLDGASPFSSPGRAVHVTNNAKARLENLSIINGNTTSSDTDNNNGGGVLVDTGSELELDGVNVENNTAFFGGGIFTDGILTITNSEIKNNSAIENPFPFSTGSSVTQDGIGAGIAGGPNSTVTIKLSEILDNKADFFGGGLATFGQTSIDQSSISGNNAENGAGIANLGALTLTNSTVDGNVAALFAGGLGNGPEDIPDFDYSLLTSPPDDFGKLTIINTTISGNQATYGAGLVNYAGDVEIRNSTVTDNVALEQAGGLGNAMSSGVRGQNRITIGNSIVSGNIAPNDAETFIESGTNFVSLGFNLVGQNSDAGGFPTNGDDITLANTVDTVLSPLAKNGGTTQTHALLEDSPAIDQGSNVIALDKEGANLVIDQRGGERSSSGLNSGNTVDIGAYEATSSYVVTLTDDTPEIGTLRAAVDFSNQSQNNNSANIANPEPNTIRFDEQDLFKTPQPIVLLNGPLSFEGSDIPIFLDGLGVDQLSITSSGDSPSQLFEILIGEVTLADVTFEGGQSNLGGAGLIQPLATLNLVDSLIQNNTAEGSGGGLANRGTLKVSGSELLANEAEFFGGAIANLGGTAEIFNSTIHQNKSGRSGGGIANLSSDSDVGSRPASIQISDSTLANNETIESGAGLYNFESAANINSSTFTGNVATQNGGAIATRLGALTLNNSTISGNRADQGGGLFVGGDTDTTHITVAENISGTSGGGIFHADGQLNLKSSLVTGNNAATTPEYFLDPDFDFGVTLTPRNLSFVSNGFNFVGQNGDRGGFPDAENVFETAFAQNLSPLGSFGGTTETHALLPGSEAIDAALPFLLEQDQRGINRPQGSNADAGAFESRGFTYSIAGGADQETIVNTLFPNPTLFQVTSDFDEPFTGGTIQVDSLATAGANVSEPNQFLEFDDEGKAQTQFQANTIAGTYDLLATSGSDELFFQLTNLPDAPASIKPIPEFLTLMVNEDSSSPLQAQVSDQFGNLLSDVPIQFTAPTTGPSIQFTSPTSVSSSEGGISSVSFTGGSTPTPVGDSLKVLAFTDGVEPAEFSISLIQETIPTPPVGMPDPPVGMPEPPVDTPEPPNMEESEPLSRVEKIEDELEETLPSNEESPSQLPQIRTPSPAIGLTPNLNQQIQLVESTFTTQVANFLGSSAPEINQPSAVQQKLKDAAAESPMTPAIIYTFFAPGREPLPQFGQNGRTSTLIASTDPWGMIAQAEAETTFEEECLARKASRSDDPLWQFDTCGWGNFAPTVTPANNDDRLVLLLVTPEGRAIRQVVPNTRREDVLAKVKTFQRTVTDVSLPANQSLGLGQQLYDWLINPLADDLKAEGIDNLVFIMDEGLRSMPLAAMHDGSKYLIEDYTVGLMPSMSLADTDFVSVKDMEVLAMGANQFQGASPLPAVPVEISTIAQDIWQGETHLNESFTPQTLINARQSNNYGIVHLATHGEFRKGDRDRSYIQFWDQKVRLDELSSLKLTGENPVSLLVLSACNTALGEPNAELGFTGLAVATGVQTAMGGLWYINDVATLGLMTSFYQNLKTAPIKAEALRQAQLSMLRGETKVENNTVVTGLRAVALPDALPQIGSLDLSHPYYWSGITMIGTPW